MVPRGSPSSSSIGVRRAGSLARKSGSVVLPQTSRSSKSRPAARTKIRAVRVFTLGARMFRVLAAMRLLLVGVLGRAGRRQRLARALGQPLDRVGQVGAVDVVV